LEGKKWYLLQKKSVSVDFYPSLGSFSQKLLQENGIQGDKLFQKVLFKS